MANTSQSELLDLIANNAEVGFRLEYLEVYNWGTFDKHVWRIEPKKHNALLTGDIGSGKSTLVDAITTLLVPHHRIVYNKAAGAESKERNLYSYIRGEYKNEKDDFTQSAKAITLRDENNYTVLLACFYNSGISQSVTLAQVFWLKDNKRNPEKFFIVARHPLTIAKHFSGFDSDILTLKKQLRKDEHIELFDNFKEYSHCFRHLFGIENEQALDLFYQTVSMKSVGNLNEFIRHHMLEKSDSEQRINELRNNFDNLNRTHEAVLKAKQQIELLKPLAGDIFEYEKLGDEIKELRQCRDSLYAYFATQQLTLLKERILQLGVDIEKDQQKLKQTSYELQQLYTQEGDIRQNINENGGQRIEALTQDMMRLDAERLRKQKTGDQYATLLAKINLQPVSCEDEFYQNLNAIRLLQDKLKEIEANLQLKQVDVRVDIKAIQLQQSEISIELDSLKKRQNNIPTQMLAIRQGIASTLDIDENKLPYVGELLQVAETESVWEGAIERVLHTFGLSLLVVEEYYSQVNHYVERTKLKGRLIYYKISQGKKVLPKLAFEENSLVNKLKIKTDEKFVPWLEDELSYRFNYICCQDMDEFRRLPQAMTANGLIKSKGQRHEKDDRHDLNDRGRFILGWSNQSKISALTNKLTALENRGQQLITQLTDIAKQQEVARVERDTCRDLLAISHFEDINWQALAKQIQVLSEEKQEIEKSSDILKTLKNQLEKIQQFIQSKSDKQAERQRILGAKQQQLDDKKEALSKAETIANQIIESKILKKLDQFQSGLLETENIHALTLSNLDKCQTETRSQIQKQIDNHEGRHKRLTANITQQMQAYKNSYPAETQEVDAAPEASSDYIRMLRVLEDEDLPRHEKRFKDLLNEGTINSIALFQNQLNREKQEIQDRIQTINLSLREIEYNPGTYIKLLIDTSQDVEIRDFKQDLRQCLQNTLNEKSFYDEDKFLQVKALIERFNGREGLIDLDRRWTQKVCDVRNWFIFSASERWVEDDTEKEFYSDSSGKSGGQKEKLAYTILASALAYQFGLEWGVTQSRSFRFVVIDEAFGKGSNESTRYGLELFKKLNLQLLIVTPLQKIHIIEDYINSIHFIVNKNGNNSVIRNLTIEEYQQEKSLHHEKANDLVREN